MVCIVQMKISGSVYEDYMFEDLALLILTLSNSVALGV